MHTFLIMEEKLGSELIPTPHLIRVLGRSCQPPQPWKKGAAEGPGLVPGSLLSPCSHSPGICRKRLEKTSVVLFLGMCLLRNELLGFWVEPSVATSRQGKHEGWTWAIQERWEGTGESSSLPVLS